MSYLLQWQQPQFLYWLIPIILSAVWYRWRYSRAVRYRYSLVRTIISAQAQSQHIYKKFFTIIRLVALCSIALLIAMPRLVDVDSKLPVEGIDIMLVLDVSGSMQNQDDQNDPRTRIAIAKEEAIRFVQKRENDAIGLVLFANDALSRIPLTMDKQMLKQIISELEIGFINPSGTLLFTGMLTAANRLKHSKAKSKIMILLTDGEPTDGDMSPHITLEAVRALGIKVYTVGIGSDETRYIQHPFGLMPVPGVNKDLLINIAKHTGGQFFLAKNQSDMRMIYDTINSLERSEQEFPSFGRWYDLAFFAIWAILIILFLELFVATFVWFSI
jgi:Ca-activated chloride channel family protein